MKAVSYWFKEKFWLTPALYGISAVLLSLGFFYVDLLLVDRFKEYIPSILLTRVDLAKTIMGSLSGALLTMSTFTFSTVLVVLTMYSSQFSPRALKNFVHDPKTWRVLGIFLAGFIYNTLSLLFMRDDLYTHDVISTFVGIIIALFSLAAFAYFIHYIATTIQVNNLVEDLLEETEQTIEMYHRLQDKEFVRSYESDWQPIGLKETVTADKGGYLQFISFEGLRDYAIKQNLTIVIEAVIGDYVYEGKSLMHVYRKEDQNYSLNNFYTIGTERSSDQDLSYALQKLVEVALRAISPGINDPNTANDIIIRIGRLLGKMGHLNTCPFVLTDSAGKNIVLYRFPVYDEILYYIFFQLSHYGKEDISVLFSMVDALKVAADIAPSHQQKAIWNINLYIFESLEDQDFKTRDRELLQEKIDQLAEMTNQRSISLKSLEGNA